jgi:hypothetical protein
MRINARASSIGHERVEISTPCASTKVSSCIRVSIGRSCTATVHGQRNSAKINVDDHIAEPPDRRLRRAEMKTVALDEIGVPGALDRDVIGDGVVFRRLPSWTRHQIADIQLGLMVTMPAGVRLEFQTDAADIELDVMLTLLQINDRPVKPAVFDFIVDGDLAESVATTEGTRILYNAFTGAVDFQPGEPTTIRFAGLGMTRPASVEVWLPHDCVVVLRSLRVTDGATVTPPTSTRRRWVHHGSSISHCLEATQPTSTWPAIAARRAGVDLQNLAFAGQCMLDQMVARTIRDLPADFISVKAGINIVNGDTMRERTLVPALHGFLDTIRDGHPTAPIALITPIICPPSRTSPARRSSGETNTSTRPRAATSSPRAP